ncbi:uncharacterized protein G2W53_042529 [Senna tora]|uniref:Uncharacterized protein n=1 Tax=Senna tora TaxID=362788 RepID=A0A834VZ26_9FABA|nr:uncharacterized protein G2W53_042529 [Senna tora]
MGEARVKRREGWAFRRHHKGGPHDIKHVSI